MKHAVYDDTCGSTSYTSVGYATVAAGTKGHLAIGAAFAD